VISADEMRPSSMRRDTIFRSIASRVNGTLIPPVSPFLGVFLYLTSENVKGGSR
jgi:hypothetical protein